MASNGNDTIFFEGSLRHLMTSLTNAYSGKSYYLDDDFYVNTRSYDGLNGFDTLFMTNFGDALFIEDHSNAVMKQMLANVEVIIAGNGGDVIDLSSTQFTIGDIVILGGAGNDILWGNAGNDTIIASTGDDIVDGGPGNDTVYGDEGHDVVGGGLGHDYIEGGEGNDILYGGHGVLQYVIDKQFQDSMVFPNLSDGVNIADLITPGTANLGIVQGNLSVDFETSVTLTFRDGFAGYNNTLGAYEVAADGTILSTQILWGNVKTAGIDTVHQIDLPLGSDGGSFGFFIIANGDNTNNHYTGLNIAADGVVQFLYHYGQGDQRLASIYDRGSDLSLVYNDGMITRVLTGPIYHTTDRSGNADINPDHTIHAMSGLVSSGDTDSLRVGFEDLPNLGDADYEDVLFDLNFSAVVVPGIHGTGDDILIGGAGNDLLYGEDGADIFAFRSMDGSIDTIKDFNIAEHDSINITDLLEGFDAGVSNLNHYIQLFVSSGDTQVRVNADGDIGGVFTTIAVVEHVIFGGSTADLVNNGMLVVDQSVAL